MANDDDDLHVPDRLANDLASIYRSDVNVPRAMDEAVLMNAGHHFGRRRSRRLILRIGAFSTAAAAIIVVAIHFAAPPLSQPSLASANHPIDIVDALRVARDIKQGRANPSRDDFNHDGRIDQTDVDAIAMAAVKLPTAGVQ